MAKEIAETLKARFSCSSVAVKIGKPAVAEKNSAGFVGVEFVA